MALDQFYHQILGTDQGPQLVFLHGLMGSGTNWRKITTRFQDAYHILLFDQRGHGRSFHPPDGFAPENYAEDLKQILDELGWNSIILVGHSMGGRNALQFASRWPERVKCLVLEDIGPNSNPQGMARIQELLAQVPTPYPSRAAAKKDLLEDFPRRVNDSTGTLAAFFYSNIQEQPDGSADWRFSKNGILSSLAAGRDRDLWAEFEGLQMPTLVMRGEHSLDLSAEMFQDMLRRNPRVQGVTLARSGHWIHFDQPEKFAQELLRFFESVLKP